MSNIATLLAKDVKSHFSSMTAYVLMTIFLILSGFFFSSAVSYFSFYSFQLSSQPYLAQQGLNLTEAVVGNLFFNMSVILLLMMPIITMRTLAEEQKQGTFELLMTYPVKESEIVLGKFLSTFIVFIIMLLPTVAPLLLLKAVGGVFEWSVVATSYFGVVLLGAAFLALGIFASSLTENQIVSAVVTFGFLLILWMVSWLNEFLPPETSAWANDFSLIRHLDGVLKDVVDLKHVAYYGLFSVFFLFLTVWRLESRRWVR